MENSPIESRKSLSPRVLVADEEALIRWSMAETLAQLGQVVTEAAPAKETIERLSGGRAPDVLDYRLPDANDLALLDTIPTIAPGTAVVMMTGRV